MSDLPPPGWKARPSPWTKYRRPSRSWANSIKADGLRPAACRPGIEDGTTKKFENHRALAKADIAKIVEWVDAGAPLGDIKDMPRP